MVGRATHRGVGYPFDAILAVAVCAGRGGSGPGRGGCSRWTARRCAPLEARLLKVRKTA